MVSKTKDEETIGLMFGTMVSDMLKEYGYSLDGYFTGMITGWKYFYLSTTVICDMDLKTFPFDKNTCVVEVSQIIKLLITFHYIFIPFSFLV